MTNSEIAEMFYKDFAETQGMKIRQVKKLTRKLIKIGWKDPCCKRLMQTFSSRGKMPTNDEFICKILEP